MKNIQRVLLLLLAIGISNCTNAQIWKIYRDSAEHLSKKNGGNNTEFYTNTKRKLEKDSLNTLTYGYICHLLGVSLYQEKQYKKATESQVEAIKIFETLLGKNNLDYAETCESLALIYLKSGSYLKSEKLYLEVLQIHKTIFGKVNPEYAKDCNSLGLLYLNMEKNDEAEKFFLEAKEIIEKKSGKESFDYTETCINLADCYDVTDRHEKAEELLLEVQQIREKKFGKASKSYVASINRLAKFYYFEGKKEKSESLYSEAKMLSEKMAGKQSIDYAESCDNIAAFYFALKQYDIAEVLYLESKQIKEQILGKKHPDYAHSCNKLGQLYSRIGQYDKSQSLLIEAKEIYSETLGFEDDDYVGVLYNLVYLYGRMVQYDYVESLLLKILKIQEKMVGKEDTYANTCNNLAGFYLKMGQYEKAEPYFQEANLIEQALGEESHNYAMSCMNFGNIYLSMGQYDKAEVQIGKAKQILGKISGNEDEDYALSCYDLANLYSDMGQYEKSKTLYDEAKRIWEKSLGKEDQRYGLSCLGLGSAYSYTGDFGKAEPLIKESKEIFEKILGKQHPDYAYSCNSLGNLYYNMGLYNKSEILLLEAKQIREKTLGNKHPDFGMSCDHLAELYWILNQPLKAEEQFKESISVNAEIEHSFFQFTNEKEKSLFIKNKLGEDNKAYSFFSINNLSADLPYSISLFHRNLILSFSASLNKNLFFSEDTLVKNKYNDWVNLKKYLSVLYSKPASERKDDISKIEEKANQVEKEITKISSKVTKIEERQNNNWQVIQQNLKVDEIAIEFAEFQFYNGKKLTDSIFYVALLIRKDATKPEMIKLFEKTQLNSILKYKSTSAGRVQLSHFYSKNNNTKIKSLYDVIWKPIEAKLTGIKKIYFAPAGSLYKIAFAALPINTKEVLSDKYQLIQLNTTASVGDSLLTLLSPSDNIILYGGVQYDADSNSIRQAALKYSANDIATRSIPSDLSRDGVGEFYYLTGSENEVSTISKLAKQNNYSAAVSEGMLANEESFKLLFGKNSPSILHIATHGFFFPDPKNKQDDRMGGAIVFKQSDNPLIRSGLALAGANNVWKGKPVQGVEDGILTAYEVSNMYLPNTKLAVLSACETGLGDIQGSEGVYGLQRAFKMAGVENLIMSLWKVDDAATSEFMREFYKNLFEKQTISTAFYNAQTIMKNKYRNDPYKWAAWVLIR